MNIQMETQDLSSKDETTKPNSEGWETIFYFRILNCLPKHEN